MLLFAIIYFDYQYLKHQLQNEIIVCKQQSNYLNQGVQFAAERGVHFAAELVVYISAEKVVHFARNLHLAKVAIFTTNIDAENQCLINHKCICGALNRHFCQTRVMRSCTLATKKCRLKAAQKHLDKLFYLKYFVNFSSFTNYYVNNF